jgi:hypothetical protein
MSVIRIFVRRDSAVKLVDDLAGESPASANCPVGTVVISGDGAGDQAAAFETRYRQHRIGRLAAAAKELGYQLTPVPA